MLLCEGNSHVNSLLDGYWISVQEDDIGDPDDPHDSSSGSDHHQGQLFHNPNSKDLGDYLLRYINVYSTGNFFFLSLYEP